MESVVDDYTKQQLRRPWMVVFLDGRNEHGSHVLPMPGSTMDNPPGESLLHCDAERIISEAEAAGHAIGDCVVTTWQWVDYGDHPSAAGWEYGSYHADLTAIMCGTPYEQQQERVRADAELQNEPA